MPPSSRLKNNEKLTDVLRTQNLSEPTCVDCAFKIGIVQENPQKILLFIKKGGLDQLVEAPFGRSPQK